MDDILAVGRADLSDPVYAFFKAYILLAEEVGVRLPEVNLDKTKIQSPDTTVTALGMEYDTVNWSVRCPEEKLGRMLGSPHYRQWSLLPGRWTTWGFCFCGWGLVV